MMEKRGAVELSVTTIVVVVIGITLLVLGLTFVGNIFDWLGTEQEQLGRYTDAKIREIFEESEETLNIPLTSFEVKQGDRFILDLIVKDLDSGSDTYKLGIDVNQGAPVEKNELRTWFSFSNTAPTLQEGDSKRITILIKPPSNAPLGDYIVTLGEDHSNTEVSFVMSVIAK